jgi:AI-2E family transporter
MEAGHAAWTTLVAYVRATILVAFVDAVGIGLALVLLRVDFALVLAALVFLAAFIPIVGATVSGAVAVLVALVDEGPLTALIVLAAVILVQQLESHVLQPLIMGRAVSIHPLAVIVAPGCRCGCRRNHRRAGRRAHRRRAQHRHPPPLPPQPRTGTRRSRRQRRSPPLTA